MSHFRLIRSRIFLTPTQVVTFDSLTNEIPRHIKLAEITEDTPTGLIMKIFFYDQLFHGGYCVRLVSASAFSTEGQIFCYTIYQTDNGPKK
jgi:hypothetical protein